MNRRPSSKTLPRGAEWQPTGNVQFQPVPFKLLKVSRNRNGEQEYVSPAPEFGAYASMPFDPWRKGDLVVICQTHSSFHQGKGQQEYETWHVARRDSTPSHVRHAYKLSDGESTRRFFSYNNIELWRIPYRYRPSALRLMGQEFETRQALEEALL